MRGTVRSTNTLTFEATAPTIGEAKEIIARQVPPGFDLVSAQPAMSKSSQDVTVTGLARSTVTRDVEGSTLEQIRLTVPDGWQLIAVRDA